MKPLKGNRQRVSLTYRLLDRGMRLVALVVPAQARGAWLAEWDGELWYGVAAKPSQARWRAAAALAVCMLRDALDARRLHRQGRHRPSGAEPMRSCLADMRHGLRLLGRTPGFTAVVVVTLAIGIGAATTIFSVVNSLLLNPLPYPDAERLVMMWMGRSGANVDRDWFSGGQFSDIQSQTSAFEQLTITYGAAATMTGRGRAAQVGWVRAPSSYLHMLGAEAAAGRIFNDDDDRVDASPVALLTHGLWQRAYGGDPQVIGEDITLDGSDYAIVGVLSADVLLDDEVMPTMDGIGRIDVVLSFPLLNERLTNRDSEMYNIVGRLRPGVTLAQAQADLDLVAAYIRKVHESDPASGFFIRAVPLIEEVVGGVRRPLVVLLAAVGVLLLVACVNVANLLLARASSRRRELAVRAALGAARRRLVRQLLTESALLAAIGGVVGFGLATAGLSVVRWLGAASLPRLSEIGIDGRVLAFSSAVSAATCLMFGLLPAWRASRIDLASTMRTGGRGTVHGGALWSRFSLSSGLVVAEVGLSLALLVGGGLLTRSFVALQGVDPGFRTDDRLSFSLYLSGPDYSEQAARIAFYDRLEERLRSLPGVESVGAGSPLPFARGVSWAPISIENYVPPQGEDHEIISDYRAVTSAYFETMGIAVTRGRGFDERDHLDAAPVALIDENFAETYFPQRDPIGMRLTWWGNNGATIIGTVATVKHEGLDRESRVTTYLPQAQMGWRRLYVVVKTAGDPEALAAPVRRIVQELDDELAVVDVLPMNARVQNSLAARRFSMALLQVLSATALLLAAIGIYGLVSYRVSRGAHELGLRMALGASPESIRSLVLGHGLGLASAGVVVGLGAALVLTSFMRSMLFGVSAIDGWTFAMMSAGLVLTALIACYIPARRATKLDPLDALRNNA